MTPSVMVALAAVVCGAVVRPAAAPQAASPAPQAQGLPVFRGGTDVIQVDVSVIDKNRRPVRGLAASDFTILEDGKPQPIVAFAAVDVPENPPMTATWMRDVAPDVRTNAIADAPDGRLIVLLIDDALIPGDAGTVAAAKKAAASVVDHLGPRDQMAVVFSAQSGNAQDFTSDRAALRASIDRMNPGRATYYMGWDSAGIDPRALRSPPHEDVPGYTVAGPTIDQDIPWRQASLRTLESVADTLIAAPSRRKALFYVSPGMPINLANAAPKLVHGAGMGQVIHDADAALLSALPDLFLRMQRANVAIYPIDPSGVAGIGGIVARQLDTLSLLHSAAKAPIDPATGEPPPGTAPISNDDYGHFVAKNALDFLEEAAGNTGGRAIVNLNEVEPEVAEIFEENASYYLLGYRATPQKPGFLHRLAVKVDRPGVEAHTRSGFYGAGDPAASDSDTSASTEVARAVASPLPSGGVPMSIALAPIADGKNATVAVVVGFSEPLGDNPTVESIDLEIAASTEDGLPRGTTHRTVSVNLGAASTHKTVHYEAVTPMTLKPGRYSIRAGAYRHGDHASGSVFGDVDVPDFANDPLSLSGLMVSTTPPTASSPADALQGIVDVVPTAARVFDRGRRVSVFARVYQAAKRPPAPVPLTVRVVDAHDAVVFDNAETFAPDRFDASSHALNYSLELPMASLKNGEYLLTLQAGEGAAAVRRDVRFSVGVQ